VIINLIKCAVGAGSFSLPFAFVQTGIVFGAVSLVVFGIVAAYTMGLLADAEKTAIRLRGALLNDVEKPSTQPQPRMTYPEMMEALFPAASICGRNILSDLVAATIMLTSVGVSIAYCLFIVTTFSKEPFSISVDVIILLLCAPVAALAQLRSFKYLAFTSVLGDVAVTAGIVGSVIIGLCNDRSIKWPSTNLVKSVNSDFGDVAKGLATISFLFLVHMVTLPMAQSLNKDLEEPKSFKVVSWVSYAFIGGLNLIFTVIAVCIFAEDEGGIANPLTDNLGSGAAAAIIKVLLSIDLLFTIPMIMAVGREIAETSMLQKMNVTIQADQNASQEDESSSKAELIRTVVRLLYAALVLALASGAVHSSGINTAFGDVLNLVGGLANTTLGLILPPIAYHRAQNAGWNVERVGGVLISLVGLTLLATSTYYTLDQMVSGGR
jgi:amino acid permease